MDAGRRVPESRGCRDEKFLSSERSVLGGGGPGVRRRQCARGGGGGVMSKQERGAGSGTLRCATPLRLAPSWSAPCPPPPSVSLPASCLFPASPPTACPRSQST